MSTKRSFGCETYGKKNQIIRKCMDVDFDLPKFE
jgi:hypothetical protein